MVRGLSIYILSIYLIIFTIKPGYAGLTIAKPCGHQVICSEMQFCSPYGNICQACSDVCDVQSHNYHVDTCHLQCQDYLHNQQFVKRSESARDAATLAELSRDVKRLQVVAWLSMAFSGVATLLLIAVCASKVSQAKRRHGGLGPMIRNKLQIFKSPEKAKEKGPVRSDTSGLRLEIPPPAPLSQSTPTAPNTASTTLPSTPPPPPRLAYVSKQRSPCEDATLDYAYDNPGLAPSPTSFIKPTEDSPPRRETNF